MSFNNNNDYTLGKVGKYNVVIAVLPNREYSLFFIVSIASNIQHSFPNVRIGLIVGIGGGALSRKHNICLGDIIINTPHDGKGGVF